MMKRVHSDSRKWLVAALAASVLAVLDIPCEASAPVDKVSVKSTILVTEARVNASCLLNGEAKPGLKEQLEKISIGTIAKPLGELQLPKEEMLGRLGKLADLFEFPQYVQILRRGEILMGKEIGQRITEICRTRVEPSDTLEIDLSMLPKHIALPGTIISWRVRPLSSNALGMILFSLEADCEGGKVRQILQVEACQKVTAAKLKRLVSIGETISPEDIIPQEIKVKNLSQQGYIPFDQVAGHATRFYKSAGSFFRNGDLTDEIGRPKTVKPGLKVENPQKNKTSRKDQWIIKPGEEVEYWVKSGSLCLKVPAKALEGGSIGDSIKLMNLQNHRNIDGVIVGEGRVEYAQK